MRARIGAAALIGAVALLAALSPRAGAQETAPSDDPALTEVATCLRTSRHLLVAFVIDESNSLQQTDPDDRRVAAARIALDSLADLAAAEVAGAPPTVEVFVGAFALDFEEVSGWADVSDPAELERLEAAIDELADRDQKLNTDIPTALAGARDVLAERAARVPGADPCRMMLFFTDGRYDLVAGASFPGGAPRAYAPDVDLSRPGTAARVERLGRAFVCDPDGVADQLRADGVVIVTAALTTESGADPFLTAITTGEADGFRCGSDTRPEYGSYTPVDDVTALIATFNELVERIAGGTVETTPEAFELEPPLSRVGLLVETGDPSVVVAVDAPDGSTEILEPGVDGSARLAGTEITWTWAAPEQVSIDVTLPADTTDQWRGEWAVTRRGPTGVELPSGLTLTAFTAWQPALVGDPELVRGEEGTVEVQLVDAAGEAVDPATVGARATVTATLGDPATGEQSRASVVDLRGGRYRVVVTPAEEGSAPLSVAAELETASGRVLDPVVVELAVDVTAPVNEAVRIGLFLAILLPGILLPIAVLALVNRRLARYSATSTVRAVRVPLLVERTLTQILRVFADGDSAGDTVLRLRAGGVDPHVLDPNEFAPIAVRRGPTVRALGLEFHAHPPRNPFGEASASVRGLRGEPLRARVAGDPRADEHDLPLALPGTWVVVAPGDGGPISVTASEVGVDLPGGDQRQWVRVDVVVFVAGTSPSELRPLIADLGDRLGATANAVADEVEGLDRATR